MKYIKYTKKEENIPEMVAIDGTTLWLWHFPNSEFWLIVNRVVAVLYSVTGKNISYKDYIIKDTPIMISTDPNNQGSMRHDEHRNFLKIKGEVGREHITLAQAIREHSEYAIALNLSKKYENTIIALDGNLSTHRLDPFKTTLQELIDISKSNNNYVIGIVKTNRTKRFGTNLTDEVLVEKFSPKTKDLYFTFLPPNPDDKEHPKYPSWGKSYLVKFHTNAFKWFRTDVAEYINDPSELFGWIANYSSAEEILGYPLPLIDAHQGCISLHKMRDLYLASLIEAGRNSGLSHSNILDGIIEKETKANGDFHSILDNVTV